MSHAVIQKEDATVYRGGGRRWFTKKAAARAEAGLHFRLRHPCECENAEYTTGYPGYECENHGERRERFVQRVSNLLLKG